ncbi:MAG: AGE family epimerase/isomerase [Phormidesmis sp.]
MPQTRFEFSAPWSFLQTALVSAVVVVSASQNAVWGQEISPELANQIIDTQILTVDRFNGGYIPEDNASKTEGFGAYGDIQTIDPMWNGFSFAFLNRDFSQRNVGFPARQMNHLIGQARSIYINAKTHQLLDNRNTRFRHFTQQASDFLIETAWDETYGGWYWGIEPSGENPPLDNSNVYGPGAQSKHAYGQVHTSLSLAKAYAVTGDERHLEMALMGWQHFQAKHGEAAQGYTGAYASSFNRDYTEQIEERNLDYMLHALETAIALYEVTEGEVKKTLLKDARDLGDHILNRMIQTDETSCHGGACTRAYVPWYFTSAWQPMATQPNSQEPNYVSPGHQFEYAFFLSRAVELGIGDESWLATAERLIEHGLHYTFNEEQGSVHYDKFLLGEEPYLDGEYVTWWPQAEAARALAHFAIVRDRPDLWDEFESSFNLIQTKLTDPIYGGWFTSLSPITLAPIEPDESFKAQPWKVYYHATMLQMELIRLSQLSAAETTLAPVNTD